MVKTQLLILTLLHILWRGHGQSCSIGKKPQVLGDGWLTSSGLFLNTLPSMACNDSVIKWRFCYYVVVSPEATTTSKPKIEVDFGIWHKRDENGSTLYSLVNSTRWSPVPVLLSSSFEFVCQKLDLQADQQLVVDPGDELVVGVHMPTRALNASHTLHFVGVSNQSTVYHYGGNGTGMQQSIGSSSLSRLDGYGLYLEAEIGASIDIPSTEEPQMTVLPHPPEVAEADSQLPVWALYIIAALLIVVVSLVFTLLVMACKFRAHRMTKFRLDTLRGPEHGLSLELRARVESGKEVLTGTGFLNPSAASSEHDTSSPQREAEHPTVITSQDTQASSAETEARKISAVSLRLPKQPGIVKAHSELLARQIRRTQSASALIDLALYADQPMEWHSFAKDEKIYEDLDGSDGQEKRAYSASAGPAGLHQPQTAGVELYALPDLPNEGQGTSGQNGQLHSSLAGHIAPQIEGDDLYATPSHPTEISASLELEGYSYPYFTSHTMPRQPKKKHVAMTGVIPPRNVPRRTQSNDPWMVSPEKRTGSLSIMSSEGMGRKSSKQAGQVLETESNAEIQLPSLASAVTAAGVEGRGSNLSEDIYTYMNEDEYPVNLIGVRQAPETCPAPGPTSTANQPSSTSDPVCVPAWKKRVHEASQLSTVSTDTEDIYMNDDEYPIPPLGRSESPKTEGSLVQGDGKYMPLLEVTREEHSVYEDPKKP